VKYHYEVWKLTEAGASRLLTTDTLSSAYRHVMVVNTERTKRGDNPRGIILAVYLVQPDGWESLYCTGGRKHA